MECRGCVPWRAILRFSGSSSARNEGLAAEPLKLLCSGLWSSCTRSTGGSGAGMVGVIVVVVAVVVVVVEMEVEFVLITSVEDLNLTLPSLSPSE